MQLKHVYKENYVFFQLLKYCRVVICVLLLDVYRVVFRKIMKKITVIFLRFWTDCFGHTVQTEIRLPHFDLFLPCLHF